MDVAYYESPVGCLTLGAKEDALVGLWMEGQKYYMDGWKGENLCQSDSMILRQTKEWLDAYFSGKKPNPSRLKLAPRGSSFRQSVWKILCEIPYGTVMTYGEIARQLTLEADDGLSEKSGIKKASARSVGGAVGHNPISIIIPCHRVVGAGGKLTGYAGGMDRKEWLLKMEGIESYRPTFGCRR
ncbi:MAG: methylated-DNA--[protein]-cysteine S-methyltransferase [Clostridiales bacterium]|nr:methylated-DNA--[protein]-cysteine S-methyltransferase [Clostridiales bacterium]